MNRYMRERLMNRDGRRGVPGSGRRDRSYDDRVYMDEYPRRRGDSMYEEPKEQRGGRGYERSKQPYRSDRNYQRDMRYEDYDDYRDFEYNYDMKEHPLELREDEIKKWESKVKNSDGGEQNILKETTGILRSELLPRPTLKRVPSLFHLDNQKKL